MEDGPDRAYLDDWDAEIERWRKWREDLEAGRPAVAPVHRLDRPSWHRPGEFDVPTFGWFSDHEWAVTVRADPKYL